jgi:hypothetical protein
VAAGTETAPRGEGMSLFWGRYGDSWEPEGGERREWRDLQPDDLVVLGRKVWRVREVRPVPVIDWDKDDRERFRLTNKKVTEEDWRLRPLYLIVLPAHGGKRQHFKVRPWRGLGHTAYVLHPHYPVCTECGEPWPCPEIGITREVRKQAAEVERLSSIMPGCCWSCAEPVTGRQSSVAFEGENLLLPGAPSPVFHLRRTNGCRPAAMTYEDRWVDAGEGRPWRLQCPGRLVRHIDGSECDRPDCPGEQARHASLLTHVVTEGGVAVRWAVKCARCRDAVERGEGLPVAVVPENFPADIYREDAG